MTLRALPRTFQAQVAKSAKTLDQFSVEELLEFLETCLEDSDKPLKKGNAKGKNSKKNNNNLTVETQNEKKRKNQRQGGGHPKRQKKFCRICKENGKSFKIYQSHNPSECKFKKKEDKREQKLYALVKQMSKKIKKFEKRATHEDGSESDSTDAS